MATFLKVTFLSLVMVACNGGGTLEPRPPIEELAKSFIKKYNDFYAIDISLVKAATLKKDYIIVQRLSSYIAIDLSKYELSETNIVAFVYINDDSFYYDLEKEGSVYIDPVTGTRFEKQNPVGKNLSKIKALKEKFIIEGMAEQIHLDYGFSVEKSEDLARFAYSIKNAAPGAYNTKDYNQFFKELTGVSLDDIQSTDPRTLSEKLEQVAAEMGTSSGDIERFVRDLF